MLNNQDRPSKTCPLCSTGRIYTGDGQSLNGKVGNKQACPECVTRDIINRFMEARAE